MTRILIIAVAFVVGGGALLGVWSLRAQDSGLRVYDLGHACLYAEGQSNFGGVVGRDERRFADGANRPVS